MGEHLDICLGCSAIIAFLSAIFFGGFYTERYLTAEKSGVIVYKYSDWSPWSDCPNTCGVSGTRFRFRSLQVETGSDGPEVVCEEPTIEQQPCNRFCYNGGELTEQGCDCRKTTYSGSCCDCKNIDCELSTWTEWSSCGENAITRVRSRDEARKAECAGARCEGPYMKEVQSCNVASILDSYFMVSKAVVYFVLKLIAGLLIAGVFAIIGVLLFNNYRPAADKKKIKEETNKRDNDNELEKD
ncbi:spondin-1-like [Antedon mediterranea]|uniref:spondin-1-like n=1 Tax=Antedon mediterranea TaxID=105859 RepID=UPI003AF9E15C